MKNYQILPSQTEDLDFACYLFEEAIKYQKRKGYPEYLVPDRKILQKDIEEKLLYKVLHGAEIIGMFEVCYFDAVIWRERDKIPAIYLHRITVNPAFKGQQLFGKILNWAIDQAREKQIEFIRLDTWDNNPDLVNYYLDFGFKVYEHFTMPDSAELSINCRKQKVVLMELAVKDFSDRKSELIEAKGILNID